GGGGGGRPGRGGGGGEGGNGGRGEPGERRGVRGGRHQPLVARRERMVDGKDLPGGRRLRRAGLGRGGEGSVEPGKRRSGAGASRCRGLRGRPLAAGWSPAGAASAHQSWMPGSSGRISREVPLGTWWTMAPRARRVLRLARIERWMSASLRPELREMVVEVFCPVSVSAAETLTIPSVLISKVTSIFTSPRYPTRKPANSNSPSISHSSALFDSPW